MSTTLILIRHGESEANRHDLFAGHSDFPLTERGHMQAERTAAYLDAVPVDVIYASDLRRAHATAEHLADRRGLKVTPLPGMREIFAGKWEGMSFEEIMRCYPEDFRLWRENVGISHCTEGESVAQLQTRVAEAVAAVLRANPGKTVVIATHATPIRALMCTWQGMALSAMKDIPWVPNASVTTAVFGEDCIRPISFTAGDGAHLAGMSTVLPANV